MISTLIEIKTPQEIDIMREASRINLDIINKTIQHIKVGMSTQDLDNLVKQFIKEAQVEPAFLNYQPEKAACPFPSYACICINNEVFHSPSNPNKLIKKGDLVTIDLGIKYKGFYADEADTVLIGDSTPFKLKLIEACKVALHSVLPLCVPGRNLTDVTLTIDKTVRSYGFFPVQSYGGHQVGTSLHMAPYVSNHRRNITDFELCEGMVLAMEPAALQQDVPLTIGPDGWTISAPLGVLSAHYEREIIITPKGGVILQ